MCRNDGKLLKYELEVDLYDQVRPFEIEEEIMQAALEKIFELLEKLYIEQTSQATSKYAKKRIKVDIKILLKNIEFDEQLKFTPPFKHLHFNLLIS